MALFTPSEGKIKRRKRQNKRGKTRNFLINFVKILVKRARKLGLSEEEHVLFLQYKAWHQTKNSTSYLTNYQHLTNTFLFFQNNYQKPYPVIIGHGHFRSFSFRGRKSPPIVLYKYIFIYTIEQNDRIIFENDRK